MKRVLAGLPHRRARNTSTAQVRFAQTKPSDRSAEFLLRQCRGEPACRRACSSEAGATGPYGCGEPQQLLPVRGDELWPRILCLSSSVVYEVGAMPWVGALLLICSILPGFLADPSEVDDRDLEDLVHRCDCDPVRELQLRNTKSAFTSRLPDHQSTTSGGSVDMSDTKQGEGRNRRLLTTDSSPITRVPARRPERLARNRRILQLGVSHLRAGVCGLVVVGATLAPAAALAIPAASPATGAKPIKAKAAASSVRVFPYTGQMSTWTVPSGVTQATFDAYGAQGGGNPVFFLPIIKGGKGGYTSARINVTPGENIYIFVGGEGHNGGTSILTPSPEHSAGGFNGGGNGGFNRHNARAVSGGGGGGGASDIRIGGTGLANRVIVAGGGGGSSE